jgi:hypothetical protein
VDLAERLVPWGTARNARVVLVGFLLLNAVYLLVLVGGALLQPGSDVARLAFQDTGRVQRGWVTPAQARDALQALGQTGRDALAQGLLLDALDGCLFAGAFVVWIAHGLRRVTESGAFPPAWPLAAPLVMGGANLAEDLAVARLAAAVPDPSLGWTVVLDITTTLKLLGFLASVAGLVALHAWARSREKRRRDRART